MAFAQASTASQEEGKRVVGEMIDYCVSVIGADYLEQKCSKLDKKLDGQLAESASICKKKMETVIGIPVKMIQDIDAAAKATVESHACNDEAKTIAIGGFNRGERLKEAFVAFEKQLKPGQTMLIQNN
ncbi:MAG: hypothetical protein ACK5ZH_04595 [Alphaproteobacteria bacterium]|jgi:hypothetical protein